MDSEIVSTDKSALAGRVGGLRLSEPINGLKGSLFRCSRYNHSNNRSDICWRITRSIAARKAGSCAGKAVLAAYVVPGSFTESPVARINATGNCHFICCYYQYIDVYSCSSGARWLEASNNELSKILEERWFSTPVNQFTLLSFSYPILKYYSLVCKMHVFSFLFIFPILTSFCSAAPREKRAVQTGVKLYAYGTNVSGLAIYYGVDDGTLLPYNSIRFLALIECDQDLPISRRNRQQHTLTSPGT